MPKKGFTLIELLIVLSIIAILSAIGMMAYSAVMKQGRDAKRMSDLRAIQSALEQYYADQLTYPPSLPTAGNPFKSPDNKKTYLNQIPSDPDLSKSYLYEGETSYCVYAKLENPAPPKPAICSNTNYNFAVTPP